MTKSLKRKLKVLKRIKQFHKHRTESYNRRMSKYGEWRVIADRILLRDEGRCRLCGSEWNTEVHHIIPKSRGGTDEERNLITLCGNHHTGGGKDSVHTANVDYYIPIFQDIIKNIYKSQERGNNGNKIPSQ